MARVFKREGYYWLDFNDAEGRRRRINTRVADKRVATEILNDKLAKVAKREHLGVVDDSKISFSEFVDQWWQRVRHTLSERTAENWKRIVEVELKPTFGGSLRSVTLAQVESYAARRIEGGVATSTVNNALTVLRHVVRRAIDWELLRVNPIAKMKMLKAPPGRTRFLTPDEIEKLLASFPRSTDRSILVKHYLKPFVLLALNTGMRRAEMLGLERKDIDWQNAIARLGSTKNGESRHVFLNAVALDALRALPVRLDTPHLFPFNASQVSVAFSRVVERAGLLDFRLHDTRHSFASYQAMSGLSPRALQELLGHKDARMTMRYSHLSNEFLQAAVNRVEIGGRHEAAAG